MICLTPLIFPYNFDTWCSTHLYQRHIPRPLVVDFLRPLVSLWPGSGQCKKSLRAEAASRLIAVLKCLAALSTRVKFQRIYQEAIMAAQSKRALAPASLTLPDQLDTVIKELFEVSDLAEFLCTSVMRVQDTQEGEFSLSFGESSALIRLMQALTDRLVNAATDLNDIRLDLKKEVASHE
jgi:hypothetical protein